MRKPIIMIPASLLLMFGAFLCFGMLYLSWNFTFPEKTMATFAEVEKPSVTRAEYVQPTEAPTEPPTEAPTEPPQKEAPYQMTLDMGTLASYRQSNPEVAGWIKISGTAVNYPIMNIMSVIHGMAQQVIQGQFLPISVAD